MAENTSANIFAPKDLSNTEHPTDAEGRVYHVGAKKGEIANRVVFVGDPNRATVIKALFDTESTGKTFHRGSTRGFSWYTGLYKGVPMTVMATGMGYPMMDFAVRELRQIVDGPLCIIRLGSSGSPHEDCKVGDVVVSKECILVTQDQDALYDPPSETDTIDKYYHFSKRVSADAELTDSLVKAMKEHVTTYSTHLGLVASCDTYYASQGRLDSKFDDRNQGFVDYATKTFPDLLVFEMESHQLLHLAKISKGGVIATTAAFVFAQRASQKFLKNDEKHQLEHDAGKACLECLLTFKGKPEDVWMSGSECVWTH